MPQMLSTEGPALATADVDGDGRTDLYLGGGKGQAGGIYRQETGSGFYLRDQDTWEADAKYEDIDALFVDVDDDDDLDLYVVSGGNEFDAGHALNQDRLYIQESPHGFYPAEPGSLPEMRENGACVRAADWDGDGDQDLFVGNRSVPGSYGLSPPMQLLENEGGGQFRLLDLPEAGFTGMVTDAAWDDYDGDGDPDLFVVGDWMPITLYENENGQLHKKEIPDFAYTHGWWRSLLGHDFDGDGDTDWIAGNMGLNSSLRAGKDEPCTLYVKDFDQNGDTDPILCEYNEGVSYPIASKDEMLAQIVSLRKKYVKYRDYAGQTVEDILGKEALSDAVVKKVNTFASSYIENLGEGRFSVRPLPMEAQFAPINAMTCLDADHDGYEDVVLGGNFFGVGPNLGRFDGSFGWWLSGNGKGEFSPVMPATSGLWIEGEVRGLKLVENGYGDQRIFVVQNDGRVQIFGF